MNSRGNTWDKVLVTGTNVGDLQVTKCTTEIRTDGLLIVQPVCEQSPAGSAGPGERTNPNSSAKGLQELMEAVSAVSRERNLNKAVNGEI